jgi:thiamine-phosphate pyrophosphorylase
MAERAGTIWRAIDANANRAREGLRVCEDLARFCLDSESGFRRLRALRYALTRQLIALPGAPRRLVEARDSERDVGRRQRRAPARSIEQLLLINLQRVKEALRVLEESCRVAAPARAATFQALRFRVYDTERRLVCGLAAVRHPRSGGRRRPRAPVARAAGHRRRRGRAAAAR